MAAFPFAFAGKNQFGPPFHPQTVIVCGRLCYNTKKPVLAIKIFRRNLKETRFTQRVKHSPAAAGVYRREGSHSKPPSKAPPDIETACFNAPAASKYLANTTYKCYFY
jgi:hypothetical protein